MTILATKRQHTHVNRTWLGLLAALFLTLPVYAGTLTGQIAAPNTSIPLKNATVNFNLSQSAYVSGSFLVTADQFTCYTDKSGSVVGVPDPTVLPIVSTGAGGSLSGTYYVVISYYGSGVETNYSPEYSVTVGAGGTLTITAPIVQPASATGYKVYMSTTSGTETLQATTVGWGTTLLTTLASGTALPASNTTVCSLRFNDELIPSFTSYNVNITSSLGRQIPGFPQRWYLSGGSAGTINVGNGYPITSNVSVFPQPLQLNPTGNAQQSVNSPVTFNGYNITAGKYTSTVATGTEPVTVTSTTPPNNLTVKNLNATTAVNTANVDSLVFTNPAAPRTITFPDPTGNGSVLYNTSATIDCTLANVVCTLTSKVYFEAAGCNGSTSSLGWDTFSSNAPVSACITGSNTNKGVMNYKAGVNLEQQKANNLNPASATTITLAGLTTTSGNLLIAVVSVLGSQTITGCNDGSAYTLAKRQQNGTTLGVEIWYRQNASALSGATLTCTAGGSSVMGLQFYEYSGAAAVALDATQGGTGTGTALNTTATATTAQASELIFAAAAVAGTSVTPTANMSGADLHTTSTNTQPTGISAISEGATANATGTFTGAMTIGSSAVWSEAIATFKAASTTAPTQAAQRGYLLPADFVAPLNVNLLWLNPAAVPLTGNVKLGVATACTPAGSTDDPAFNAASTVTAANPATALTLTTTAVSAVTITGCTAGSMMHLQVQRVSGDAADNSEQPVQLYGVEITYSRQQ